MDSIKQIRGKIESLMTCSDSRRCPTLSERYHKHVLEHHPMHSNQARCPDTPPIRSNDSLLSYSNEKSTVSLGILYTKESPSIIDYNVQKEIIDWSKNLPVYYNSMFEEMKQNVVNELVENMNNLFGDTNTMENLFDKLKNEIGENIKLIPLTYEQHKLFETNLLNRLRKLKNRNGLSSEIKSRNNIIYHERNVIELKNKRYRDITQNSYIDILKNISPVLLSKFKLTSINISDTASNYSQLYKYNTKAVVNRTEDFNNSSRNLSLQICKPRTQYKDIIYELSNYTAILAKCRDILKDKVFDIRSKLNVSNLRIREITDIKEIQINMATGRDLANVTIKVLRDSLSDCCIVYRTEAVKPNVYLGPRPRAEQSLSITNSNRDNPMTRTQDYKINEDTLKKFITNEINSWIVTLPQDYKYTQGQIKNPPIKYLVHNLVDYFKIDSLFSENNNVRENCLCYFAMNWLYKTKVFKNLNHAKPHVESLIERFNEKSFDIYFNDPSNNVPLTDGNTISLQPTYDEDSFKNELLKWLLEKETYFQDNVKINEKNRAISKTSKCLYEQISKQKPYSDMIKGVSKLLKKLVKSELKNNIETLSKELIDRLNPLSQSLLTKIEDTPEKELADDKTQASNCTDIETEILECSLKKLLLKYIDALSEEENLLAKEVYRLIFKNKIQTMLDSKLCLKNNEFKEKENILSYNLITDLENIEMVVDWIKSASGDKTISRLETNIEIVLDIIDIFNTGDDNIITKESTENYKRKILDKLTTPCSSNKKNTEKLVSELLQRHLRRSQKSINNMCKTCYKKNRSEVIDDYIFPRGEDIVKESLQLNVLLKRITREIKYHCMCHLSSILIHNEFDYVKEVCNWLNNLPLLSANDKNVHNKTVHVVFDFIYEIKSDGQVQDNNSCIENFIEALPLNKHKEIDIKLATLQLKERLKNVDRNNEINNKEENISKIDIVIEIENWCQNLPVAVSDEKTSRIFKQRLAWDLLKKVGELSINSEFCIKDKKTVYEKDVTLEIDTHLNSLPSNDTLKNNKDTLKRLMLNKFMENFKDIETKHSAERFVIHLSNLIELSLRSNANMKKEENVTLIKKIRDALVSLSLIKQFEPNHEELTTKYFLFIMEEICAYLQYAKALFIVPFLLDVNDDLFTYDVAQYKDDPFMAKLLKFIKTKAILGNWINTLPIQKANGLTEVIDKYEMLSDITKIVIEIENQYSYNDPDIDKLLIKCLQILPISNCVQETVKTDLKNILKSSLKERSNCNSTLTKTNSNIKTNNSKCWYSIPPADTINDNSTKNFSNINGKYTHIQKVQKSSNRSSQHKSSKICYQDFEKGIDLKSSAIEPSLVPIDKTIHSSTHRSPDQHQSSTLSYQDFEKGVDIKSSTVESSRKKQSAHNSSHKSQQGTSSTLNYEGFKKGVDFKSSLIEVSPIKQESRIPLLTEQKKPSCAGAPKGCHKSCSPMKIKEHQEQETNNQCVPNCKTPLWENNEKSSQTQSLVKSSLTDIHPLNYQDFEEGVNLRSSTIESSPIKQPLQSSSHKNQLNNSSMLNYEEFIKGADLKSSLIVLSPIEQNNEISLPKEQKKPSCSRIEKTYYKACCPLKNKEQLETNNHCVPNCKTRLSENQEKPSQTQSLAKASQTTSLTAIHTKKETSQESPDGIQIAECNQRSETTEQDVNDTLCKCHRKCLPCYVRRYCKICNTFPLRYPEFHYW